VWPIPNRPEKSQRNVTKHTTPLHNKAKDSSPGLLGCDTLQCCGRVQTFPRFTLPPSSGWRRHKPEYLDLKHHRCERLNIYTKKMSVYRWPCTTGICHSIYKIWGAGPMKLSSIALKTTPMFSIHITETEWVNEQWQSSFLWSFKTVTSYLFTATYDYSFQNFSDFKWVLNTILNAGYDYITWVT
jgi:hypothetical protein